MSVQFQRGAFNATKTFVSQELASSSLSGTPAAQRRPNLVFGGYGVDLTFEGFATYSFATPLIVLIAYPSTGNMELDADRAPMLQV